jgi:two-component system, cell cycle response regulator DivK
MDIQLPVLDGYETTRQIKTDPKLKATPVIAISSYAMKGDEKKARTAGCDHYVTKPCSPMQLLKIIRGYLGDKSRFWVCFGGIRIGEATWVANPVVGG